MMSPAQGFPSPAIRAADPRTSGEVGRRSFCQNGPMNRTLPKLRGFELGAMGLVMVLEQLL